MAATSLTEKSVATCLALYDCQDAGECRNWVDAAQAIEEAMQLKFSHAYWTTAGAKSRHASLSTVNKRLQQHKVDAVTYEIRPKGRFDELLWDASLTIMAVPSRVVFFGLRGRQDILSHVNRSLEALSLLGTPVYGFGYQRAMSEGPGAFAYGVNWSVGFSSTPWEEKDRTAMWLWDITDGATRVAPRRYRFGLMRDIYPVNVLSDIHLKLECNGLALREWIDSSNSNGTLSAVGDGRHLWLWTVAEREIERLRETLRESSLLVARAPITH